MFAECCVFVKQSQPPLICDRQRLHEHSSHLHRRTFSRSYGTILPSSFTRVLSSALIFFIRPPVLVWGTASAAWCLEVFPGSTAAAPSGPVGPSSRTSPLRKGICLLPPAASFHRDIRHPARLALFVTPSQLLQYGNINPLSIGYAFRPCLRNRLTLPRLTLDRNPWSSGGRAFNPSYRYSRQHSHFRTLQETFRFPCSAYGTLPYHLRKRRSAASAVCLSPVTSSARADSTSELLRYLLMMAASKPTSWLSVPSHIVSHLTYI